MQDRIDQAVISRSRELAQLGVRVLALDQCASTNVLLAERARAGELHASAIVCEHQSEGKGRQGHRWVSMPGDSLTYSLLWRFDLQPASLSALSLVVAVVCARALELQGASGILLKWPNDLLFDGRKLGGILIETFHHLDKTAVVIGVGLNVSRSNSLGMRVGHAIADLRQAGLRSTRTEVLIAQLASLCPALRKFESEGFAAYRDEWLSRHAWQGRRVRLLNAGGVAAEGEAVGVADDGALLVKSAGVVKPHYSGELSLRTA